MALLPCLQVLAAWTFAESRNLNAFSWGMEQDWMDGDWRRGTVLEYVDKWQEGIVK